MNPDPLDISLGEIDLETQGDAVKQFFLSFSKDPEGAIVKLDGHALARVVPIGATDDLETTLLNGWNRAKNSRRCFLIDREIDGTLTPEEARELAALQRQMIEHRDRVAPLPLEATRRLYNELLAKAEASPEK